MPSEIDKPNPGPGDMLEFLRPDQEDDAEGQMWFGGFTPVKLLYRRYTGHHPDLLMRVIRSMHSEIRGWNEVGDYPTPTDSIDKYIAEAESEIAKERES